MKKQASQLYPKKKKRISRAQKAAGAVLLALGVLVFAVGLLGYAMGNYLGIGIFLLLN